MKNHSSRAGLTLVEVLLAIAILTMGLTALIAAASRCLGAVRQAKNYETARHLLARVEFENPLQIEEKIEVGSESGTFARGPAGFSWTRSIAQVGKEEDGLFSVRTTVSWADRSRAAKEELVTYLYAPEKKEGGTVEGR